MSTAKAFAPPDWGIDPVPDRLRVLGVLDTGVLWGNLGVSLLLPIVAAFLVPALSFWQAAAAIGVGVVVGNAALGYAGRIGAATGAPAMVLYRPALGLRGSYAPSVLNVLQNIGWGSFEIFIIGTAAGAITQRALGTSLRPAWTILFGIAVTLMAYGGPLVVVQQWIKKVAVWLVLASSLYLTIYVLTQQPLGTIFGAPGEGGLPFFAGVDLVIAMPISWIPLVQDYTRFANSRRAGLVGPAFGYGIAHAWFYLLGVMLILSGVAENPADPVGFVAAVLAVPAGLVALGILAVDEADEAFANVYSASVSIQNLFPRLSQRRLSIAVGAVCTALALLVDLVQYESFLLLIGAVFVPLFGVLAADYAVVRRGYNRDDLYGPGPGIRPWSLVAWLGGFVAYNWINPGTVSWWVSLSTTVLRDGLRLPDPAGVPWLSASILSFLVAFGLQAARRLRTPPTRVAEAPAAS